ncbi:hypothetical protein NIB75_07030 [Bacteroides uniformis]|nr:hypothetical protein [Bacteroides uniformis]
MQLQHNKPIERKLAKLADYYNDNSIKNAFLAYVDEIPDPKERTRKPRCITFSLSMRHRIVSEW